MDGPTHLIGVLKDLRTNSDQTAIFCHLEAQGDARDESLEEDLDGFPKGPTHSVRFAGEWVKFILEDLQHAWQIHLDLRAFDPIFNTFEDRWEFDSGLQAEIMMQRSEDLRYMKKIELGPTSMQPITLPLDSQSSLSPTIHGFTPGRSESPFSGSAKRSPTVDAKSDFADTGALKRPRMARMLSTNRAIRSSRPATPDDDGFRDPAGFEAFGRGQSRKPDIQSHTPTQRLQRVQPSLVGLPSLPPANLIGTTVTPGVPPFIDLDEIDNTSYPPNTVLNVMGFISQKATEACERSSRGTQDYKMTLYLKDASRSASSSDLTCNLFWKTEAACPIWAKANWQVVFLWHVRKRNSEKFNTQIIGASGGFAWALWAPQALGTVEVLEFCAVNRNFIPPCYLNPEGSRILKRQAAAMVDTLKRPRSPSLAASLAMNEPESSGAKRISDLKTREPGTVSLCVELIDVWSDGTGNYRLTVTDYTSNPFLTHAPMDWVDNPQARPLSRLHVCNGGTCENWAETCRRILSVYVTPSIVEQLLRHVRPESAFSADPHSVRNVLLGRYMKLDQVCIRSRAAGGIYGLIERSRPRDRHDDEASAEAEAAEEPQESSAPALITVLPVSGCEVVALLQAREEWLHDLGQSP